MDSSADVLVVGSERRRIAAGPWVRRHRWWLVALVASLAVVATADQWQRHREMDALLTQVTAGEQTIDAANGSLQVLVDYYNPVLSRPGGGGVRPAFTTDVAEAASRGDAATREAAAAVATVDVLPWHRALLRARAEYKARVDAWNRYLAALAADPDVIFGGAEGLLPPTTRAREALEDAAPWPSQGDRRRVEELLSP
jgi:hypothetical protein